MITVIFSIMWFVIGALAASFYWKVLKAEVKK